MQETVCSKCGISKINGLFSPGELTGKHHRPRCIKCASKKGKKEKVNYPSITWRQQMQAGIPE